MYPSAKVNAAIAAASVVALLAFFFLIRQQTAVRDRQFLRSMIPHHASAILMCEQASISDPRIARLCQSIVAGQTAEIAEMKTRLRELEK